MVLTLSFPTRRSSDLGLARRLLLQGGGGEGRRRIAGGRLGLDRLDGEATGLDRRLRGHGGAFVADAEPVDLLALESDETRQAIRPVHLQGRKDAPIFLCPGIGRASCWDRVCPAR